MSMIADRGWVYSQSVKGRFQRIHRLSGLLLNALLFVTPWVQIGGHPAFMIDLPGRQVFALGTVFTASDGFLLLLLLLMAVFSLFFFTSLFGRLWCGFLCPQTVFMEEFIRPIERYIEGERGVRIRRDKDGPSFDRAWRRVVKNALFLGIAAVLSMAVVSVFADPRELWTGNGGPVEYGLVAAFSGLLFVDFAWFREQVCNQICPYARFQGALTDDESLVIAYDEARGEPRGKAARETGGCIDCKKCVTVCPQGIDIREGFQLECINCARCVDACEGVMGKLGQPSLVRYSTVAEIQGRKVRLIRPRTVAYAALISAVLTVFGGMVATRHDIQATVARAPGSLFAVDPDGLVRNTFLLQVTNVGKESDVFHVAVEGLEGAEVIANDLSLDPQQSGTVPLIVRHPPPRDNQRTFPIQVLVSGGRDSVILDTTFKTGGPVAKGQ